MKAPCDAAFRQNALATCLLLLLLSLKDFYSLGGGLPVINKKL